jgi:hypothetical protein
LSKLCCYTREMRGGSKSDPSLTGKYVSKYEKKLVSIIRGMRKDILALIEQSMMARQKEMAVEIIINESWNPARINQTEFNRLLKDTISDRYRVQSELAGKLAIEGQIQRGTLRADQFLKPLGAIGYVGDMPVDPAVYNSLQERNMASLMNIGDDMENGIREQVSISIQEGEGIRDMTTRINDALDLGINRSRMVARTESMSAFNAAAKSRYEQHGIEQVMWRTGGSNICDYVKGFDGMEYPGGCMGMNGQIFDIGSVPPAPLHPNCKCIIQPVIEKV